MILLLIYLTILVILTHDREYLQRDRIRQKILGRHPSDPGIRNPEIRRRQNRQSHRCDGDGDGGGDGGNGVLD